jgi:hypothetical protein
MVTETKTELLRLEKQFWDAMKQKDAQTAARLTDETCIIAGAQGVSAIDRQTMAKLTEEGQWTLEHYEYDEPNAQVRMIGADVGLIAYKVTERLTVDGKPLTLEANDTSVWVRRNGNWLCAMHTESLAGDPFGRDKT